MCELLIRVVDKPSHPNPHTEASQLKRGCVVDVFPDNHSYGLQELQNPHWRILKLPKVPVAFGRGFMGPGLSDSPSRLGEPTLGRAFKLDIDDPRIPTEIREYLEDDSRAQPMHSIDLAKFPLDLISSLKVRLSAPALDIGDSPNVMG